MHRNLALAYSHRNPPDIDKAITELEKAVIADQKYALHFTELDELYSAAGADPAKRLALLEKNHATVQKRDDALSREVGLKVFDGKYDAAIALMTGRKYSVWEGGSLEVADHWIDAHLLRGRTKLAAGEFDAALKDFQAANSVPENLPNARNSGGQRSPEVAYWIGVAYTGLRDSEHATQSWREGLDTNVAGPRRGEGRISPRQVQAIYQAMANQRLGNADAANRELHRLLGMAEQSIKNVDESSDSATPTSADVRSTRMSQRARASWPHFIAGLAHQALSEHGAADIEFQRALEAAPDAVGPHAELTLGPYRPTATTK